MPATARGSARGERNVKHPKRVFPLTVDEVIVVVATVKGGWPPSTSIFLPVKEATKIMLDYGGYFTILLTGISGIFVNNLPLSS